MPDLLAGDVRGRSGAEIADLLPMRPLDPAYRACFADGTTIFVRHGREAMREEIARPAAGRTRRRSTASATGCDELYQLEMPHFIDRNYDSPLGPARPLAPALALLRLGAFGRLGDAVAPAFRDQRLHRLFSFQAMYAGLAPDEALAILRGDHLHGQHRRRLLPRGRDARGAGGDGRRRRRRPARRSATATRSTGSCARPHGTRRVAVVAYAGRRRRSCPPTRWSARRPAGRLRAAAARPRAAAGAAPATYSPSAVVWHVGVRGAPAERRAHHNIHFGAEWGEAFDALLRTAG